MSHLPKEWRFLKAAWIYAFAVTGSAESAGEKVSVALDATLARVDVAGLRRRRRFLLATLHRQCAKQEPGWDTAGNPQLEPFRKLSEPGRSALLMLYLRLLPVDEISDVLGRAEKELPEILAAARVELGETTGGAS